VDDIGDTVPEAAAYDKLATTGDDAIHPGFIGG
jgi:hypothetical protein